MVLGMRARDLRSMVKARDRKLTFRPGEIGVLEAAELLEVTRRTVLRWIRDGKGGVKLPARTSPGGRHRIDQGELRAWAEARGIRVAR